MKEEREEKKFEMVPVVFYKGYPAVVSKEKKHANPPYKQKRFQYSFVIIKPGEIPGANKEWWAEKALCPATTPDGFYHIIAIPVEWIYFINRNTNERKLIGVKTFIFPLSLSEEEVEKICKSLRVFFQRKKRKEKEIVERVITNLDNSLRIINPRSRFSSRRYSSSLF